MRKFLLGCLALGLAACSPSAGDAAPQSGQTAHTSKAEKSLHPESGLPVIPLTVEHNGKRLHFRVEVAATGPEQAKGLMFRTSLGADEGMIFPMDPPRSASFWMKNTLIPLDIIYIGVDGRISNIAANAVPRDLTPLRSVGLVKGVLELRGGRAAELGIVPGDKVKW